MTKLTVIPEQVFVPCLSSQSCQVKHSLAITPCVRTTNRFQIHLFISSLTYGILCNILHGFFFFYCSCSNSVKLFQLVIHLYHFGLSFSLLHGYTHTDFLLFCTLSRIKECSNLLLRSLYSILCKYIYSKLHVIKPLIQQQP